MSGEGVAPAKGLLPDLTVGLVLGALGVTFSISLTALIYGPDSQQYLARTIGMVLTGGILLGLIASLLTSARGMIAHIQDAPAAVLGALAVSLTAGVGADGERWLMTLALTAGTTLATGLLYYLVGAFGLGGLVRYLPYPVLGGFLAGTGWLLLTGGIGIMSGVNLTALADVPRLVAPEAVARWLPGVALAVALLLLIRRVRHFLVWPLSLLAATLLFYLVMALRGGGVEEWRAAGLLVGPFPQGSLFHPLTTAELAAVRWDVLAGQVPGMLTVAFVCLIAVLLNATGIEQAAGRKVDLNKELRAAGLGNMLSSAFGGAPGYQGLSFTVFNYSAGSGGRLALLVAVGVMAATLFFGAGVIQLLPTVVLGGLIVFFGLGFLHDWLVASIRRLPLLEYLIMLAIFVAIVVLGVLPGVGVGLVLTVAMFVISSSRTESVRYATDLSTLHSRVSRPPAERAVLQAHGDETLIIQLQGFLFFGTATALADRLERHGAGELEPPATGAGRVASVILDFQRVTGVDSSGIAAVGGIARAARASGFELIVCSAPAAFRRRVLAAAGDEAGADGEEAGGSGGESAPTGAARSGAGPLFMDSLDEALEHCEQRTLARHAGDRLDADRGVLSAAGLDLEPLAGYLERRELAAGEAPIRRGEEAGALYFLVAGQLTASLPARSGAGPATVRLETMRAGSLVGELAFYSAEPRGADVTADTPVTVMVLTEPALARMTSERPELAAAVHRQVARLMAGRVTHLVEAVESLQR